MLCIADLLSNDETKAIPLYYTRGIVGTNAFERFSVLFQGPNMAIAIYLSQIRRSAARAHTVHISLRLDPYVLAGIRVRV